MHTLRCENAQLWIVVWLPTLSILFLDLSQLQIPHPLFLLKICTSLGLGDSGRKCPDRLAKCCAIRSCSAEAHTCCLLVSILTSQQLNHADGICS